MTAVETLERAISKLDGLIAHADTEHWFAVRYCIGAGEDRTDPHTEIAQAGDRDVAELIATLGRASATISVVMTRALRAYEMALITDEEVQDATALARAVLGEKP